MLKMGLVIGLILLFVTFVESAQLFNTYHVEYDKVDNGDGTSEITITVMNGAQTQTLGTKVLPSISNSYPVKQFIARILLELKSRAFHNATIADVAASGGFDVDIEELVMIRDSVED